MLYDYDEDEQSRNEAKSSKEYIPMPNQDGMVSAPTARLRLLQWLRGSGPSEIHPLVYLEALLVGVFVCIYTGDVYQLGRDMAITIGIVVGILLIVMLFIPFIGPLMGITFSFFWGFLGYALGSSFARSIGPVNSMIIGGVAALIGFSVSLKAHLS